MKATRPSATHDQLKSLMNRHKANAAPPPAPVSAPPMAPSAPAPIPMQSVATELPPAVSPQPLPAVAVVAPAQLIPQAPVPQTVEPSEPIVRQATYGGRDRYSVRMTDAEMQKIDHAILVTHQGLGMRINASEVLRVGLLRITTERPISTTELAIIRSPDARRSRPPQTRGY